MKRLEETHGTIFELTRHFLARMFDSEMFSSRGQLGSVAIGAFALAIPAGMLMLNAPHERHPTPASLRAAALANELGLFTILFAITGILALLGWQWLFPSRRDYLALAGLPVRSWQIFAARFAAVSFLAASITLVLIAGPSLAGPHPLTRAAACAIGCLFVFFAVVAIQGALIHLLPSRVFARVSPYVQGVLLAGVAASGLYGWTIMEWQRGMVARLPQFGAWVPPAWFLGLDRAMSGSHDPFFLAMAARARTATVGSVLIALIAYAAAYGRYRKLLLESPEGTASGRGRSWSVLRLLTRSPRKEAVIGFMAKVLSRSRTHRLILMAYVGGGLAVMIDNTLAAGAARRWAGGWHATFQFAVLYWPIGLAFVTLAGLRHVFQMPAEWRANWVFQITESQGRREWMSAVERFVMVCAIAPIHLAVFALAAATLGWPMAMRMTVLQLLVSLAAFELLFDDWRQLPFTCSYVPGKTSLMALLATWLVIISVLLPLLATVIAEGSRSLVWFAMVFAIFAVIWLWARRRRRDGWGEEKLIYEDNNDAITNLGISELRYRVRQTVLPSAPAERRDEYRRGTQECVRHVYRSIVRAFPDDFQSTYGEDLLQVTEETVKSIGPLGYVRLLLDLAIRIPIEHAAELWQDARYGLRALIGSPGFTSVALISLSLGMCIATCAFSEMNGMVWRHLPQVLKPEELVALQTPSSYPSYRRYRQQTELFSDTMAYVAPVPFGVTLAGRTDRIWGQLVTPSYFSMLGVQPSMGRFFEDEQAVVVSYRFWQDHRLTIGETLRVNGESLTVLGVGPKDFYGASPLLFGADLWVPISVGERIAPELAGGALERHNFAIFTVAGRLKPGVSMERAEAALDTVARTIERDEGNPDRDKGGRRVQLLEGGKLLPLRKQDQPFFTFFLAVMAGLVMAIACANVANMMLARAAQRRKETAVRLAMGASRGRLVRQLLTESMLVAVGAGTLGFLASMWLMRLMSQVRMPVPMPVAYDFHPDGRVLMLTLLLTLATGLAFGLAPALQATRSDLTPALKEGGATLLNGLLNRRRGISLRNVLMVSQVAGSLTLLVILGVLSLGIQTTMGVATGFDPSNLSLISFDPVRDGYSSEQAASFFDRLLERVKRLPAVTAACISESVPVAMPGAGVTFTAPGATGLAVHHAIKHIVGDDYFSTVGTPILLGRAFHKEQSPAIVVSEALVNEFWRGQDPLGRRIEIASSGPGASKGLLPGIMDYRVPTRQVFTVVGVARDVTEGIVVQKPRPAIYFPLRAADYATPSLEGVTLIVRGVPGVDMTGAVEREVAAVDARITPYNTRSMETHIAQFMAPLRMAAWTYGLIGVFGLALAAVGLAGVTAYSVTQRSHEIGIRMALGARGKDVLGLVMREGLALVTVGTVLGACGAWAGLRMLSAISAQVGQVNSVSMSDPVVIFGSPALLAALALVACYAPARKSTRIDPAVTLRRE